MHSFSLWSQYKSITVKPSTRNDLSEQTKHLPGPTPVPEQADFPPAPQKKKVKRYFKWKDNYLVQCNLLLKVQNGKLFCKSCTAFPTKKNEFVKGWSVNEDGFKDEYSRGMMKTRSMLHAWRSLKKFMLLCQITSFLTFRAGQRSFQHRTAL